MYTLAESAGWFGALTGLVVGLVLGSFAGMASWRWPRELNWITPSACPTCNKRIGALHLVPVFSWLFQRGKSSCCGTPIHWRYPLTELTNGLLIAVAGWYFGIGPHFVLLAILITTLVLLSAIDFETTLIPDGASITVALVGVAWLALNAASWQQAALDASLSVGQNALIGVLMAWGYSKLRGRYMFGWGDVKLMAASGFWLQPHLVPAYIMMGAVLGLILGAFWKILFKREEFPFAPALAVSLLVLIAWQADTYWSR